MSRLLWRRAVPAIASVAVLVFPNVTPGHAAQTQQVYYVAPPGPGSSASDANDCLSASTACATFYAATVKATEYAQANPSSDVAVYAESGVYDSPTGLTVTPPPVGPLPPPGASPNPDVPCIPLVEKLCEPPPLLVCIQTTCQLPSVSPCYSQTVDPSSPADGQTIDSNTITNSGAFAANSVADPTGGTETVFTNNYIASNNGGLDLDQNAQVDSNTFYANPPQAIYLDPSTAAVSAQAGSAVCPVQDTLTSNTFYGDGTELRASGPGVESPDLQYNVFYASAGGHITDGDVNSSCEQPTVDSNDYYNESVTSANFNYGTNAKYENPQFSTVPPASAADLTVNNSDLANVSPPWGAMATPGPLVDSILAQTQLLDSNSTPIANASIVIRARPAGQTSACTSVCPQVATGNSDANGYIQAVLNLSGIQQNSAYDTNDVITLDVFTVVSGNQTFAQTVPYTSGSYDPFLEAKQLLNGSAQPLNGATVQVLALPLGSTGSPTQIGTGTTDGAGHAYVTIDTTPILNNPAFLTVNSVASLEIDYQAFAGDTWHQTATYPEAIGMDNDPVLMAKKILTNGSPVSGADIQAYAVPVGTSGTGTSGYPLLASGTTAPDGTIHLAPLDLTGVQQNSTYEGSNDIVKVRVVYDACATGTDSSPNCTANPPLDDWQYAFDVNEYFGTG